MSRVLALFCCLITGYCQAGIYGSLEKAGSVPAGFAAMRLSLGELRGTEANDPAIPVEPGSLRAEYQALRSRLEAVAAPTSRDLMELGVANMRLGQAEKAMIILEKLAGGESENGDSSIAAERFQLLLNLAACYAMQSSRQQDLAFMLRAVTTQRRGLDAWPESPAKAPGGWDFSIWRSLLAAEEAQLRLWKLRLREGASVATSLRLEAVMGTSGQVPGMMAAYSAGPAPSSFWRNAPEDGLNVTRQLLLWTPSDNRLFWLYGEWLNARGEVANARSVLEELVDARRLRGFPELVEHWQVLRNAADSILVTEQPIVPNPETIGGDSPERRAGADLALPNWQTLLVGIGAGAVLAMLARMQLQKWRGK